MNGRKRGEWTISRWLVAITVALGGMLAAAPDRAFAQKGEPDPSVARLSFAEGDVSYLNADLDDEWAPVDVNAPLFAGDRFYAGDNAKAEIQLGPGAYVRLSSETEIDLMDLGENNAQVRVGLGTATFRLHDRARQELEISTPGAAIVAKAKGVYRVDVADDGHTTVLVRDGDAELFRDESRYQISRGRGAEFDEIGYQQTAGSGYDPVRVFDSSAMELDAWDDWEASRAARVDRSSSYQYVSGDVYGVEDLDEYGSWQRHDDYGPVWRPTNVAPGWSPFTDGRWVWQGPYGWTWVDYSPWGWAPSHYGRWVYVQNSWGWAPGPIVTRPVYSPAVVGFLGINTGAVSIGVGFGTGGGPSVGWVPLGYGEPVVPWWGGFGGVTIGQPWWGGWGGPRIVNNKVINKNITNININNIHYANMDRFDGIPVATRDGFTRGEMRRLNLRGDELRNAVQPLRGAPDIVPARESLFAARPERVRQGRAARPRAEALDRAVVATREGGRARLGASFDEKAKLIQERNGRPLPPQELSRVAASSGRGREGIRTVRASGTRAVTPEVTAEAPRRAGERVQRADVVRGLGEQRQEAAADRSSATGQETRQGLGRQPAGRDGSTASADGRARDQIRQQREERRATSGEAQGDAQSALRENALRQRQERARVEAEGERPAAGERGRERASLNESPRDAEQRDPSASARRGTAEQERQRDAAGEVERAQRAPTGRERPATARPDTENAQRSAQGRERQERARVESQQNAQERASAEERASRGNAERAPREQVNPDQQERQRQSAAASESRSNEERAQRERAGREQQERARIESARRSTQERERQQAAERQSQSNQERAQREQAGREQQERARIESARRSTQERERQQAAERQSRTNQERTQREQAGRQRQEQARAESARRSAQERDRQQAAERQARGNQERAQREQAGRQRQEQARAESARRSAQERDRQQAAEGQARTNQERAQRQQSTRTESSSASRDDQAKKKQSADAGGPVR